MSAMSSPPGALRFTFKALTALLVAGAWGALGYGLLFSRPDVRALGDLEAGGRLGLNLFLYLPYFALTLPLVAVVLLGLFPRPDQMFPIAGGMAVTGLFAVWILQNDSARAAMPELTTYALAGMGLAIAAILPLLVAHGAKVDRGR